MWIPLSQEELYLDSRQTFADFLEFAAAEVLTQLYTGPLEIPMRKKEKSSKSPLFLSDMKQNKKETSKTSKDYLHES